MLIAARIAASALVLTASVAQAQGAWPAKPVRVVVPSSPGGGTDTLGRLLAAHFTIATRQQFVIENRAGAAGLIGYQYTAKLPGDGYNLLVAPTTITTLPLVRKDAQYDVLRDFAPITQIVASTQALVVHPSVPARTTRELVALAKRNPNEIAYASPGDGSLPHLAMELLASMTQIRMIHVPYKGVGPGLTDVIGGRVVSMLVNVIAAKPHIDNAKLRAVAVSSRKRAAELPAVPTIGEAGYGEYEALQWFGLFAPAGTPPDVLSRVHELSVAALRTPEMAKRLVGQDPIGNSPQEFSAAIKAEVAKWTKVVRGGSLRAK